MTTLRRHWPTPRAHAVSASAGPENPEPSELNLARRAFGDDVIDQALEHCDVDAPIGDVLLCARHIATITPPVHEEQRARHMAEHAVVAWSVGALIPAMPQPVGAGCGLGEVITTDSTLEQRQWSQLVVYLAGISTDLRRGATVLHLDDLHRAQQLSASLNLLRFQPMRLGPGTDLLRLADTEAGLILEEHARLVDAVAGAAETSSTLSSRDIRQIITAALDSNCGGP